jgi:hypothetical protein
MVVSERAIRANGLPNALFPSPIDPTISFRMVKTELW